MPSHATRGHCALRAPTVFSVRIKTIRTENTVMDKNKDSAEVLCKIADCARTGFRPRNIATLGGRDSSRRAEYYPDGNYRQCGANTPPISFSPASPARGL
jgi:hypothetical protein